jgi:hypothetical protein
MIRELLKEGIGKERRGQRRPNEPCNLGRKGVKREGREGGEGKRWRTDDVGRRM